MYERVDVRVEGDDDGVTLVLPRKMDDCVVSWQDAYRLGETLERAAAETPNHPLVSDPTRAAAEAAQVKLNTHKGRYVVLVFGHTDRVRLSPEAAVLLAGAIKVKAQDLDLASRGVRVDYDGSRPRLQSVWKKRMF